MAREEGTGVAVRAHSQDQQVKHRDGVSLEGLMGGQSVRGYVWLRGDTE